MTERISKYNPPFLIYDEECPLCLRFKQALERSKASQEVNFYPLQDKNLYHDFLFLNPDKTKEQIHFVTKELNVLTGESAIEELIKYDPIVKRISWLVESKMGQKALSIFYKTSDKYRKSLRKRCNLCNH